MDFNANQTMVVKPTNINPEQDGVDHINIYSRGKTELGRLLSNFAYLPIQTEDGIFASMEAWWYWQLGTDPDREQLRPLWGSSAKYKGRDLKIPDWPDPLFLPAFKVKYVKAFQAKLAQHPKLTALLRDSQLPLLHYYTYGTPPKVICAEEGNWVIELIESERTRLQAPPIKTN